MLERCGGRLDGAVMAAGLGPGRGTGPSAPHRRGQLLRRRRAARGLAAGPRRGGRGEGRRLREQLQHDGADGARPGRARVPRRRHRPGARDAPALRQAGADLRLRGQQGRDQPVGTPYGRHAGVGRRRDPAQRDRAGRRPHAPAGEAARDSGRGQADQAVPRADRRLRRRRPPGRLGGVHAVRRRRLPLRQRGLRRRRLGRLVPRRRLAARRCRRGGCGGYLKRTAAFRQR